MTTVIHRRTRNAHPPDQVVWIDRMSKWGNPYSHLARSRAKHLVKTRAESIERFTDYWFAPEQAELRAAALIELKDKILVCWCKPLLCHGDILARYVNDYYASVA